MELILTILIIALVVGFVFEFYIHRNKFLRGQREYRESEYTWLTVVGPSGQESMTGAHYAAFLLLRERIRMKLGTARLDHHWAVDPVLHSTESLEEHRNAASSIEEFTRYVPWESDCVSKLSVHPEDVDKGVRVLEDAGLTVEQPPGRHWWH